MTQHPILFNTPMIKAILRKENPKTRTMRPIKHEPFADELIQHENEPITWRTIKGENRSLTKSPFGVPGDELWVRETWKPFIGGHRSGITYKAGGDHKNITDDYAKLQELAGSSGADLSEQFPGMIQNSNWRPSIHMPRWASLFI